MHGLVLGSINIYQGSCSGSLPLEHPPLVFVVHPPSSLLNHLTFCNFDAGVSVKDPFRHQGGRFPASPGLWAGVLPGLSAVV